MIQRRRQSRRQENESSRDIEKELFEEELRKNARRERVRIERARRGRARREARLEAGSEDKDTGCSREHFEKKSFEVGLMFKTHEEHVERLDKGKKERCSRSEKTEKRNPRTLRDIANSPRPRHMNCKRKGKERVVTGPTEGDVVACQENKARDCHREDAGGPSQWLEEKRGTKDRCAKIK